MVKMDNCIGPELNLDWPLENRPFGDVRTGNNYIGRRTVRENGYATKPGEEKGIYENLPPFCTICASKIVERTSDELLFESPAVGLLGFHCGST